MKALWVTRYTIGRFSDNFLIEKMMVDIASESGKKRSLAIEAAKIKHLNNTHKPLEGNTSFSILEEDNSLSQEIFTE
jgi:hypothetical protein